MSEEKQDIVEIKQEIVSKTKLLETGTYFGHHTSAWNPKMKPYIHTKKNGTHIIDIQKTQMALELAYNFVHKFAEAGAQFIFVGTKKQAHLAITKNAKRVEAAYVAERWLGGTLTNYSTIIKSVNKMKKLEELEREKFEGYTKKEGLLFKRELKKLHRDLNGIRDMKNVPDVIIVVDPTETDKIAVKEAKRKGLKIIGILDTNADPDLVDIAIPANDDSVKSLYLIITTLTDAIADAKGLKQHFAFQGDEAINKEFSQLVEEGLLPKPRERRFPANNNINFDRRERDNSHGRYKKN